VTDTVIKHVEAMAEAQGIKNLKLTNRLKTRFYPADWIAGVDYDPENPETYEDEEDEDYEHEDSDEDSWVNPDEDRMSPEREEQWRADLEAWPNNVNTDSESEWDSDFDPIDQDETNDLLNKEDPNPAVTRTPRTHRGVEIVPNTLPEAETAGVVKGRPRRGPKPVAHFVSFDALMAKSKLDKDMLNKRYLGKEV